MPVSDTFTSELDVSLNLYVRDGLFVSVAATSVPDEGEGGGGAGSRRRR